jgi:hypothetical protein
LQGRVLAQLGALERTLQLNGLKFVGARYEAHVASFLDEAANPPVVVELVLDVQVILDIEANDLVERQRSIVVLVWLVVYIGSYRKQHWLMLQKNTKNVMFARIVFFYRGSNYSKNKKSF